MAIGYIKLHRALLDNPLWLCESFTRGQAWVDLLLLANHDYSFFYKRGVKIEVSRGQLARSEVELSDRWNWSRTKVRKFLNDLEKEQQIKQQKTNVTQLITLINYNLYQQKEQQTGQQKDSKKTAKKQQKNTYNNDKNDNNENNDNKIIYPFESENFIKYWNLFKEYKKKEHRFTYKSEISEQSALKKLGELAGQDEETAIKIITQSIENGWKGFFKINDNGKNGKNNGKGVTNDELRQVLVKHWG